MKSQDLTARLDVINGLYGFSFALTRALGYYRLLLGEREISPRLSAKDMALYLDGMRAALIEQEKRDSIAH